MLAIFLYVLAAGGVAAFLRRIEKIPAAIAVSLVLLPLFVTGRALLTDRIYAPLNLAYASEPFASIADRTGVSNAIDPTASDVFAQFVPWDAAVRYSVAHGQWPLWNPFEFCGGPLAGAVQSAPYHPIHLLALILPLGSALTFIATMLFFIAVTSGFLFMRDLVRFDHAALFGATAWMFSRHLVAFAGTAHGLALASMPLVLFAARRVVRSPNIRTAGLLCGALVLLVVSGHPETMLHVVALSSAYFLFELWSYRAHWRRAVIAGLAAGGAALLITAITLVPLIDAIPQTEEFRYRANFFAPPATSFARVTHMIGAELLPLIEGTAGVEVASHPDSISHAWLGSTYAGTLLFALAAYTLVRVRRQRAIFFGVLFAVGLFAGAGVLGALLSRLPLFSIAVNERMIWTAAFALCVLGALAIDAAARERWTHRADLLPLLFVMTAVIVSFVVVVSHDRLIGAGLSPLFIRVSASRAVLPLVLAAAAMLTMRNARAVIAVLFVLLVAQRGAETAGLRADVPQSSLAPHFPGLETMVWPEPFRIVGQGTLLMPNVATEYGLEDVRGYQAMTLARFHDMYRMWSVKQPVWSNRVDSLASPMLSLMNVRFALTPPHTKLPDGWIRHASFPGYQIAENTRALARAFVPNRVHLGITGAESLRAIANAQDFRDEAWIEHGSRDTVTNGPGNVRVERDGTSLVLHAMMEGGGWVVASQSAWRGWRAIENGRGLRIRNADHAFIAFYLPQGEHRVTLFYRPQSFVRGAWISAATLIAIAAVFIMRFTVVAAVRKPAPMIPPFEPISVSS
jgi:Bacterial membrane protein YfhO